MQYIINYDFGIWKEIERQVKQLPWSLGGESLCTVILGHVFKAWQKKNQKAVSDLIAITLRNRAHIHVRKSMSRSTPC